MRRALDTGVALARISSEAAFSGIGWDE